jgi:hypothetical protein
MIPVILTSRLGIGGIAFIAGIAAGWTINGWRHEAAQASALKDAIAERNVAQIRAREKEEEAEYLQAKIRDITRTNTRKALSHANDPDRQCPVPIAVVLEQNAAAMGY